jgi:hypothetical protein
VLAADSLAEEHAMRRGADIPIDFRCYILPAATHTLATVAGDREGLLVAQSEEGGPGKWEYVSW